MSETYKTVQALKEAVRKGKTSVELWPDQELSNADIQELANFFATIDGSKIRNLNLKININAEKARILARGLQHLQATEWLNLNNCNIDNEGIERLATAFPAMQGLKRLSLKENAFDDSAAATLCQSLKTLGNLQHLSLDGNKLDNQGATELADVVDFLINLESLHINTCQIGDAGIVELCSALADRETPLELDLSKNRNIGVEGMRALGKAVKDGKISKLNLRRCGIEADGMKAFADAVLEGNTENLPEFHELIIGNNKIGNEGIRHLTRVLGIVEELWLIDFDYCSFSVNGEEHAELLNTLLKSKHITGARGPGCQENLSRLMFDNSNRITAEEMAQEAAEEEARKAAAEKAKKEVDEKAARNNDERPSFRKRVFERRGHER